MTTTPQDHVPPPPPLDKVGISTLPPAWHRSKPPSRRGGKRPGAGAKPGNLNALKHGRTSRFKNMLPPLPFDPSAVAQRVLSEDRQEAERIAQSFIRVLLEQRFKRDVADAVAAGNPLPIAPLVLPTRADRRRVNSFLHAVTTLGNLEHERAAGHISPDNAALVESRRAAEQLEAVIPAVGAYLDRATTAAFSATDLTALLKNHQQNDQSPLTLFESAPLTLAALSESAPPHTPQNETIKPTTPSATVRSLTGKPSRHTHPYPGAEGDGESRHPSPRIGSRRFWLRREGVDSSPLNAGRSGQSGSPPSRSGSERRRRGAGGGGRRPKDASHPAP